MFSTSRYANATHALARRLDQLRQAQKETVGLNHGIRWVGNKPAEDDRPTLKEQGIGSMQNL
jgi:hypothetical protein